MHGRPPDVLVVDDEANILTAITRILQGEMDVSIEAVADPRHAVEILGARPPKVIVTDFNMPGLNGVEVLEEARRVAPDTVRILLTAHADRSHIIDAINSGRLFRFIPKPWDNEALVDAIREALAAHAAIVRGHAERKTLENAGDVQRALLPDGGLRLDHAEAACFTTPCEYATGDYVDVFPLASGRTALLLGDVCGHGLGAALFMFTARALLHSGLAEGDDLPRVLARANRFLARDMRAGRFLTLFAAIHDTRSGALRYVNAGHTPPLVLGGAATRELGGTAMPLGVMDEARYDEVATTPLAPGETLVVYSDGLTEARSPGGELLGPERVARVLAEHASAPPEELIERVLDACHAFVGGSETQDDLSLLVYRPQATASGPPGRLRDPAARSPKPAAP